MSPIKHCRFTSSKQVCRLPHRPCQWSTEPVDCRVQTEINPKLPTNTIVDAYRSYPSYRSISKQQLCGLVSLVLSNTYLVQVSPSQSNSCPGPHTPPTGKVRGLQVGSQSESDLRCWLRSHGSGQFLNFTTANFKSTDIN